MKKMKKEKTDREKEEQRNSAVVYDKAAEDFRRKAPELLTYKYIVRPAIERALDRFIPTNREGYTVLDIGSASGRNVHTLIALGFRASNIFGVEISSEQVEIARREIPGATFEVGDISSYRLLPDLHNLAIMIMVPEFLDDERYLVALKNIYTSMRNNGTFIYITTHPDRYEAKYGVISGEVTTKGPWGDGNFSNYVRSVTNQVVALSEAGFNVEPTEELDIPQNVDETDRPRRAEFACPDAHVRLVIIARKQVK